jgi:hypothetical protein
VEALLTSLSNFGLAGAMSAVLVWFLWHLVKTAIPEMMQQHRLEMEEQRKSFAEALEKLDARFQQVVESICRRLEQIDQDVKASQQELALLRETVLRGAKSPVGGS